MSPYRMPYIAPISPAVPVVKAYTRGPDLLAAARPVFQALAWIGFVALVAVRFL